MTIIEKELERRTPGNAGTRELPRDCMQVTQGAGGGASHNPGPYDCTAAERKIEHRGIQECFMILIRFTTRRYADRRITLRTDADHYADHSGVYEGGAWIFRLDDAPLPQELRCKFVLDGRTWMEGYDLTIRPEAGREYSYTEGEVRFG